MGEEDKRTFRNEFAEFSNATAAKFFQPGDGQPPQLTSEFVSRLEDAFDRLFREWEKRTEEGTDGRREGDVSVYTGIGGHVALYLRAYEVLHNKDLLNKAMQLCKICAELDRRHREKEVTFLCGDGGRLALTAVVADLCNDARLRDDCVERLLACKDEVIRSRSLPDELLYGRAGYLYALLFLRNRGLHSARLDSAIAQVKERILTSGKERSGRFALNYSWHDKEYLGAAHGFVGILFLLMQTPDIDKDKDALRLIKATLDQLMAMRFPSGNLPSSVESESDRLVHWCHGAPGFVHCLLRAFSLFGDAAYLTAAKKCATVLWNRGLLKKGYGLCHGVAGNAYGLLALFQTTGERIYLYQTCQFAQWMFDYGRHGCRVADRPFSLFEGMAGTLYFLLELRKPDTAHFPAFY